PLRVLNAHLDNEIPRVSEHVEGLDYLDEFIFRALSKNPKERFRDPESFAQTFLDLVNTAEPEKRAVSSDTLDMLPAAELGAEGGEDEVASSEELLLPPIRGVDLENLATADDFDHFERGLKVRRAAWVLGALLISGALIWLFVWGVMFRNLFRSHTEDEPNDTLKEANELVVGESMLGSINEPPSDSVRADRDFYRIVGAEPGDVLTVKL